MAEPTADELLGDLRSLRDRARADRRGYAFPLFLFGGLILLIGGAIAALTRHGASRG
jgi:hypothetical protein